MKLFALLPLALAAALVAGCGDDAATPPAPATESTPAPTASTKATSTSEVGIEDFTFVPKTITIEAGAGVSWTNEDTASHTATIAEGAQTFDTDTLETGQTATVRFDTPGTYAYVCLFHPYMKGTVVVEG